MMAFHTEMLTPGVQAMQKTLLDKYFLRKHGTNAYYGQKKQHTYESSKEQTISALFCIANVFTGGVKSANIKDREKLWISAYDVRARERDKFYGTIF